MNFLDHLPLLFDIIRQVDSGELSLSGAPRNDPASPNPWAAFMKLHRPACNSFSDNARGLVAGLPESALPRPFVAVEATKRLFHLIGNYFHEDSPLRSPGPFQDEVGFRCAKYTAPNMPRGSRFGVQVLFLATTSDLIFNLVADAIAKYTAANGGPQSFRLFNCFCAFAPFPTHRQRQLRQEVFNAAHATAAHTTTHAADALA